MSPRMSAAERRELAVRAAMAEFAHGGYDGTSTWMIARRVGVSQPYMFRLFPSKRALFLAAADRCFDDVEDVLRAAAGGRRGGDALAAMAEAWARLPRERPVLPRLQLKIYAIAIRDEDVRGLGRARWARLWRVIGDLSGEPAEEVARFLSDALLANVQAVFGAPAGPGLPRATEVWAENLRDAPDG
ncbi:TetR/AcrR family transcriptional regulator [Actinomadura sp. GTD37]|uniref:TetR/AcrR family transcriptional regulator n=1 Tax=Actinomadura sp. GTD37 TaxID=1778030 RepID=UPI0035BFA6C5